ncbi:MAG: TonB family protein [Bacteroidota bacterium]
MKRLMIFLLISLLCYKASAQTGPIFVAYFDDKWKEVFDINKAAYYRTVQDSIGKYLVRDHFISGKLQMKALCSEYTPKLIEDGQVVRYYENGIVKQMGAYNEGRESGIHEYWYANGLKHKIISYEENKMIYHQVWSQQGEPLLANGKGVIQEELGTMTITKEIENSVSIASYQIVASGDSIHTVVDTMPEYRGGYEGMMRAIKNTMRYPASARRQGIDGIVYVSFIIDKQGRASDVRVIRGISLDCDAEASRVVSTLNDWTPGKHRGKVVNLRFVLPLKFKLR